MWDRVIASVGGSSTWDEEDRNFGERRQGRSELEISGCVGKTEKGNIITTWGQVRACVGGSTTQGEQDRNFGE
jgi:hypothetical protein